MVHHAQHGEHEVCLVHVAVEALAARQPLEGLLAALGPVAPDLFALLGIVVLLAELAGVILPVELVDHNMDLALDDEVDGEHTPAEASEAVEEVHGEVACIVIGEDLRRLQTVQKEGHVQEEVDLRE